MSKQPEVSVVIPTYNSAKFISQCLESVINQTYQDFEILVIDDGSTDETKKILKPYLSRLTYLYQENAGPAKARNLGIQISQGKYIAFIDADDTWTPDKLKLQVRLLESNLDFGLVFSDMKVETSVSSSINSYFEQLSYHTDGMSHIEPSFKDIFNKNVIPTSTVVLRRECLEKSGLFDETLPQASDIDLWLRISRHFRMVGIPKVLACRREHGGNIMTNREVGVSSLLRVIAKMETLYPEYIRKEGIQVNKKISRIYFSLGYSYFESRRFDKARKEFINSLSHAYSFNSLKYLLLTFLNSSVVVFLRKLKHGHC